MRWQINLDTRTHPTSTVYKKYTGMTPTEFIKALSKGADGAEQSAFRKYYNENLDLKSCPIRESLEYMRGLLEAYTASLL